MTTKTKEQTDHDNGWMTNEEYLQEFARFDLSCPKCGLFLFTTNHKRKGYKDGKARRSYVCLNHHETVNPISEMR